MTPIKIDLRDLTPAHFKEAEDSGTDNLYVGPCIIGTLMTPEQRQYLDSGKAGLYSISSLIGSHRVETPSDQHDLAGDLQYAFDKRSTQPDGYEALKAKVLALSEG